MRLRVVERRRARVCWSALMNTVLQCDGQVDGEDEQAVVEVLVFEVTVQEAEHVLLVQFVFGQLHSQTECVRGKSVSSCLTHLLYYGFTE